MTRQRSINADTFVSEHQADRPPRGPLVQFQRRWRCFNCDDLISGGGQPRERRLRIGLVLPGDRELGAESRLRDAAPLPAPLIRSWRDAAEHESLDRAGVRCPKEGSRVVQAAHVVEDDHDGQASDRHASWYARPGRRSCLHTFRSRPSSRLPAICRSGSKSLPGESTPDMRPSVSRAWSRQPVGRSRGSGPTSRRLPSYCTARWAWGTKAALLWSAPERQSWHIPASGFATALLSRAAPSTSRCACRRSRWRQSGATPDDRHLASAVLGSEGFEEPYGSNRHLTAPTR